ncbi:MAG: DUF134 domain-containing protein [Peptostreptococcaceae bacterium]|nr:DUF134 domain-containing protein [Peptostreptococcaceae bacterium]
MGRPRRCRKVGAMPETKIFGPLERKPLDKELNDYIICYSSEHLVKENVSLTVDEYEVIRLLDYVGLNQEDCSRYMEIARTTVTSMYNDARRKLATAIIEGRELVISGGNYEICGFKNYRSKKKGSKDMILALPVDEAVKETKLSISFGRASFYMFYNVETEEFKFLENSAKDAEGGAGIKAAQTIIDNDVKIMLTPRCGKNATDVFEGNVEVFKTTFDTALENIKAYKEGKLAKLDEIAPGRHGK